MFGKLAVALLIAASPALAQDAPPAESAESASAEAPAPAVAYKTKRVCRSVEIVGSAVPRTTCTTKKIPIKPAKEEAKIEGESSPEFSSQL
jgi:hypothetical protein